MVPHINNNVVFSKNSDSSVCDECFGNLSPPRLFFSRKRMVDNLMNNSLAGSIWECSMSNGWTDLDCFLKL